LGTLFPGPEDGPPFEKPTASLPLLFERQNDIVRRGRLPEKPDAVVFFPFPSLLKFLREELISEALVEKIMA